MSQSTLDTSDFVTCAIEKLKIKAFDGKYWYWVDQYNNLRQDRARSFSGLVRYVCLRHFGRVQFHIRPVMWQLKSYFLDTSYKPIWTQTNERNQPTT